MFGFGSLYTTDVEEVVNIFQCSSRNTTPLESSEFLYWPNVNCRRER